MSFFNDFLNEVDINDFTNEIVCSMVLGKSIKILGNLKIMSMAEKEIILFEKKKIIKINGTNLEVKSISNGEYEIVGNVCGVSCEK